MPPVPLESFTVGDVTGHVEYNDANQRISRFYWNDVPAGFELQVTIWDSNDPSYPSPVFEGTFTASGETPIAGNHRAVEVPDEFDGELAYRIPPNIEVKLELRTV